MASEFVLSMKSKENSPNPQTDFNGKVVLVTGAGKGVGQAIAQSFGRRGALVAVNDINPDSAMMTVNRIVEAGGQACDYIFDISKKFPVQAMLNQIEDNWERIDILVNNARVVPNRSILEMDEWEWRRTLDVNLTGAFLLTQLVSRMMRAKGTGGVILHIGAGYPKESLPGLAAHFTTRSGIIGLTRAAGHELGKHGIRVNLVNLQVDPTALSHTTVTSKVSFLSSPSASHINGEIILVKHGEGNYSDSTW